ncbi:hypothetical protein F2Q69_00043244 [Brassica cretica]|uniref:Uncharacterized protein n=1 Tax=Brassica cretica TaxID=69181 RepID=A0A8S9NDE9_BRACR|nr:hypothetical protein F2Q69_00043244 [Brassica cretica]
MASKGRKQSRKRKTQVRVDDPEFIGTIYHGIEESLPLHKENPTQPQLDEPRGASDGGEELNQDAKGSNARVEEPIIDSEAANDGGEELNKDSEAATASGTPHCRGGDLFAGRSHHLTVVEMRNDCKP